MPEFIVLHTDTPDGVQKQWTELGRFAAEDAGAAFQAAGAPGTGSYLVLSLAAQFTATVQTTVTVGE